MTAARLLLALILLALPGCAGSAPPEKQSIVHLAFQGYGRYVGEDAIAWYYLARVDRRVSSGVMLTTYSYVGVYREPPFRTFTFTTTRPLEL